MLRVTMQFELGWVNSVEGSQQKPCTLDMSCLCQIRPQDDLQCQIQIMFELFDFSMYTASG